MSTALWIVLCLGVIMLGRWALRRLERSLDEQWPLRSSRSDQTRGIPLILVVTLGLVMISSPMVWAASIMLAWDNPTNATGINLYQGEEPGVYTMMMSVGLVNQASMSSLEVGRLYVFAVTAFNVHGESVFSNEVRTVIGEPHQKMRSPPWH